MVFIVNFEKKNIYIYIYIYIYTFIYIYILYTDTIIASNIPLPDFI